jgi:murein L,D-transpeptidase YcbB/YkuD
MHRVVDAALRFYSGSSFDPVWFDMQCRAIHAQDVLQVLSQATTHGLEPGTYVTADLSIKLDAVARQQMVDVHQLAHIELQLTLALFQYLSDLHNGRVNPRDIVPSLTLAAHQLDLPGVVRHAIVMGSLERAVDSAAPRYPLYERLRQALAHYRALEQDESLKLLPVVPRVRRENAYIGLAELRHMLVALGDMAPDAPDSNRYSGEVVMAVQRFQERHGLEADGVIGHATFEQLNTPLAHRTRQIELSMERLRWIPALQADLVIAVNIPEYRLRALNRRQGLACSARHAGDRRACGQHRDAGFLGEPAGNRIQSLLERAGIDSEE